MPLRGTGNHFWHTVNAEEQFYLLAPLLLVLAPERFGRSTVVWVLLALAASVSSQYSAIMIGVAAAVIARRHPGIFSGQWMRLAIAALTIVLTIAVVFAHGYDVLAPLLSICIVLLLAVEGPRQPIGAVAGGMSYPLYLNHWIGGFVARALLSPFGLRESHHPCLLELSQHRIGGGAVLVRGSTIVATSQPLLHPKPGPHGSNGLWHGRHRTGLRCRPR